MTDRDIKPSNDAGPMPKRHPRLHCADHPDVEADSWGCPDCVRFLRNEVGRLTAELASYKAAVEAARCDIVGGHHYVWSPDGTVVVYRDIARNLRAAEAATPPPAAR